MTPPEPMVLDDVVDTSGEWHRLSRRMLLIHPVSELAKAIPGLLALLVAGSSSGHGGLWGLAGACLVLLAALTRWMTTRYRITPERLQLRKGLLRRRTMDVPLDRVRTVDVTAHALHRVLGLAKVVIGTGTSDRRGRGGLELDGLPAASAASLRAELLHRSVVRAGDIGQPAQDLSTPQREYEIVRLDTSWIRYAPFTLSGALTAAALIGFAWRIDQEARVNLSKVGPLRDATRHLRANPIWVDALELSLLIIVFIALASTIGYVLSFWNFRLSRHPGGSLHVSRGLLTSRATSIEATRLRGVEVSEPLMLRAVGGARCIAIATGLRVGRGAERGGTVLLPPAPRAQALRVAGESLETWQPFSAALIPHGPAARRRRHLRAGSGAAALTAVAGGIGWLAGGSAWGLVAGGALFPAAFALAADRYRGLGHAQAAGFMVSRYGSIVRRHSAIADGAIIGWNMRSTIWQRRAGLTTLVATTAAGRQGYRIPDIAPAVALAFGEAAVPGLLSQFLSNSPGGGSRPHG
jgi:putative membrane protein